MKIALAKMRERDLDSFTMSEGKEFYTETSDEMDASMTNEMRGRTVLDLVKTLEWNQTRRGMNKWKTQKRTKVIRLIKWMTNRKMANGL